MIKPLPAAASPAHAADDWLAVVVRRYELPLRQYAGRIVGCPERARDVVQDTFLRLLEYGQTEEFMEDGNAAARWLFTVCRNRALDVCRREHRMTYLDQDLQHEPVSPDPDPAQQAAGREAAGALLRLVETLPPRQQEVIQLKFQNGLSYREISEITRLSVGNVGFLLHHALKTLRERHARLEEELRGPLPARPSTEPIHP